MKFAEPLTDLGFFGLLETLQTWAVVRLAKSSKILLPQFGFQQGSGLAVRSDDLSFLLW